MTRMLAPMPRHAVALWPAGRAADDVTVSFPMLAPVEWTGIPMAVVVSLDAKDASTTIGALPTTKN